MGREEGMEKKSRRPWLRIRAVTVYLFSRREARKQKRVRDRKHNVDRKCNL